MWCALGEPWRARVPTGTAMSPLWGASPPGAWLFSVVRQPLSTAPTWHMGLFLRVEGTRGSSTGGTGGRSPCYSAWRPVSAAMWGASIHSPSLPAAGLPISEKELRSLAPPPSLTLAHRYDSACPTTTKVGGRAALAGHPRSAESETVDVVGLERVPATHPYGADGDPPDAVPSGPCPAVVGGGLAPLPDLPQNGFAHPPSHLPPARHVEAFGRGAVHGPLPVAPSVVMRDADSPGPRAVPRTSLAPAVPLEGAQ